MSLFIFLVFNLIVLYFAVVVVIVAVVFVIVVVIAQTLKAMFMVGLLQKGVSGRRNCARGNTSDLVSPSIGLLEIFTLF